MFEKHPEIVEHLKNIVGDVVDLLGGGISYMEMSDMARTNRNECITILSRRPVRVYHQHGKIVTVLDDMLHERRDEA